MKQKTNQQRHRRLPRSVERLEPRLLLSTTPLITEFMASNASTLADGDGNFSDWIEVHNPTAQVVDLQGWFLTDDAEALDKWPFPNLTLQPNEYLVVFASSPDDGAGGTLNNYVDAEGNLHTNFSLNASGEYLGLTTSNGQGGQTVVHEYAPEFVAQRTDASYGIDQTVSSLTLVSADSSTAKALIPTDSSLDTLQGLAPVWTTNGFDDSSWITSAPTGGTGVGFDAGDEEEEEPPVFDGLVIPSGPLGEDLTDPNEDGSLSGTITVGNTSSPSAEQPPEALDGSITTKWLSFAPSGTYYQFRFNGGPEAVTAYTLTSANDASERDPYSWVLSGSNDGSSYTVLDTRDAQDFATRFETQLFGFMNTTAYQYYRFDFQTEFGVTGANQPVAIQVAEIELFAEIDLGGMVLLGGPIGGDLTDPEDDGVLAGVFSVGNANSPGGEEPFRALDNTTSTKWLSFAPSGTFYQFQFDAGPTLVNSYTISSANDEPNRDPYSWTLSGSNDGTNFSIVDTRNSQDFAGRFETQLFEFENSTSYEFYRFDFQTEFGATGGNQPNSIQLSEIELFSNGPVDFAEFIDIDVETDWNAHQTSLYQRIDFEVDDPSSLSTLLLNLQYDDGFVAYLNGSRVAESAATVAVDFNSNATSRRANDDAVTSESFDISALLDQVVAGTNVLAIQGLNVEDSSADLLLRSELLATELIDVQYVPGFYAQPTPGSVNGDGLEGFVADTEFSAERGFYDSAFQLQLSTPTSGADIYYTTNGEAPTAANGLLYTSAITIDQTTTLRAVAVQDGFLDSNIGTQTYLFVNDVVSQDYQSTLDAGFPTSWGGASPDYGIDAQVIGNFDSSGNSTGGDLFGGTYAATIKDDLKAIPTLSIVMDVDDMFGPNGIYSTPTASGVAWERATSVELIQPDGSTGFQVDAGIRIQGGAFRRDDLSKKHSLRLLFKSEYGPSKLNFPFFGADAVDEFDTITLRMDSNDGWAWSSAGDQPQYARDEFGRQTQLALGQAGSHGNRMNLYINGVYWGMYNPVERPDASFSANYYGGKRSEWDAINAGSVVDGDLTTWNTLGNLAQSVTNASSESARTAAYMFLQGKNPDGSDHPTAENYLDVDNYIDYMLVNFYGGNVDWPHRNWFASRQRGPESTGFKFHIWDMESALGLISSISTNRTGASGHVAEPYNDLRSSEEFRIRFADRAHRALFNDGALTTENTVSRYQSIIAEIDQAIVAESARWGDMHRSFPHTKAEWTNESNQVINNFLTGRSAVLLNQLRSAGLYSSVDAAVFNQHGGPVASGFDVVLTNSNGTGTIYYTTDGTDPRLIGGAVSSSASSYSSPVPINAAATIKARVLSGGQWSALEEATFTVAPLASSSSLRITEINYNPHEANLTPGLGELDVNNDDFEFLELQNVSTETIDLAGVQFMEVPVGTNNEGIVFAFGQQTLAPGEYVLVVEDQAAFDSRYGLGKNIAGEYSGRLANGGETLTLLAADDTVIQQFAYNDNWEFRTDGAGSSLVVIDTNESYNSASNWRASTSFGGTPAADPVAAVGVIINEVIAHTDLPAVDALELYNTTSAPIDLGGWWLSDSPDDFFKYQFGTTETLGGNAYRVLDESDFNPGSGANATDFVLSAAGDEVWLLETDATGKLTRFADVVRFDATQNGVSLGRVPNGNAGSELFPLAGNSLGAPNDSHQPGQLVFSEIHYHPAAPDAGSTISEQQLEFVEIFNASDQSVVLNESALGGWQIVGGVEFDFGLLPLGTTLVAGSTLVVVPFDPTDQTLADEFRSHHGVLSSIELLGPYDGQLENSGESVRLLAPTSPPPGVIGPVHYLVDRVTYEDSAPWPIDADGSGDSLQRFQPSAFGDDPMSWVSLAPTPGSVSMTPGDFDQDGDVDDIDLSTWESGFGSLTNATVSTGDTDSDGDVDGSDFLTWQQNRSAAALGDFDANGVVDGFDRSVWQSGYGTTVGANPSGGDADGDNDVDGTDFLLWQLGYASVFESLSDLATSASATLELENDREFDSLAPWGVLPSDFSKLNSVSGKTLPAEHIEATPYELYNLMQIDPDAVDAAYDIITTTRERVERPTYRFPERWRFEAMDHMFERLADLEQLQSVRAR